MLFVVLVLSELFKAVAFDACIVVVATVLLFPLFCVPLLIVAVRGRRRGTFTIAAAAALCRLGIIIVILFLTMMLLRLTIITITMMMIMMLVGGVGGVLVGSVAHPGYQCSDDAQR